MDMEVDWPLLREQKQTLLKVIDESAVCRRPARERDLTGILHLIDAVQDKAVEEGVSEEVVFGAGKD
jgi:hypothetical protein